MKIFVSSGEVSGDLHLSYLVQVIRKKYPDCEFYGVAGHHSQEAGVTILEDIQELAVMGFLEALKKYNDLKEKMESYLRFIEEEKIEKVLLIDYGGFHLKFLKALKERCPQVKVYYYIPPKLWVWGKRRIHTLRLADEIMVIFPWEVDFYQKEGVKVHYFGNPLVETCPPRKRIGDKILLLPGSRKQEILSMMQVYQDLIQRNRKKHFLLKLANREAFAYLPKEMRNSSNLEIVFEKELSKVVEDCSYAVAVSGTVTLELALLDVPTVVVYKTSAFNYFIAKYLLKVGYISLPNISLQEEVFPELIQKDCNALQIENYLRKMKDKPELWKKKLKAVREALSGIRIIEQYADFLLEGEK
ncbi:MAG TPA: lipid-A-disaccharide synthase [Fusobacterium sp.]|uniref:lipid-A-disaccharide synthase n=1 Tax=Fusobacterium sp. TaxID=68766 RepID=UPI002F417F89